LGAQVVRMVFPEIAVAADRERGEVEGAEPSADLGEARVITRVAREEEAAIGRGDHPRRPQPLVLIGEQERAPRRVLGGHRCHRERADRRRLPPVQLDDLADAERLEPRPEPERHEEGRPVDAREPRDGAGGRPTTWTRRVATEYVYSGSRLRKPRRPWCAGRSLAGAETVTDTRSESTRAPRVTSPAAMAWAVRRRKRRRRRMARRG